MTQSSSELHLYNTLSRRVERFAPLDPASPTMYVCGPTVYNYVHIGNARGPVVFGVLAALLRRRYGALRYARNITDVDDKINAAAKELGTPISAITDKYAAAYREDMAMLGVDGDFAPDIEPAATAHMPQMIAMIQRLIDVARDRRIKLMTGITLRENTRMIDLSRSLGFATRSDTDEPELVRMTLDL